MTHEEAIAFLEQYINSEVYTEKCISAHEMAITALRSAHAGDSIGYHFPDTTKMVPLTLEQLREMDGKPVRMEDLTGGTLWNQWIIFERHTDDGFIPRGGGYFGCDSYGVKWLAYAYPPARIDREAWVSVEDRMPEDENDGETVLVIVFGKPHENITLHGVIMTAGYFRDEGWVLNEYPEWEGPEVTHWMPLPSPPAELEKRLRGVRA